MDVRMSTDLLPAVYMIVDVETDLWWTSKPKSLGSGNSQRRMAWASRGAAKQAWQIAQPSDSDGRKKGGFDRQDRYCILEILPENN